MQRDVRYPDGREVSFDIMDQPGSSVLVFAWNSTSHTTTLIEEYAPGSLQVITGPVAGGCEDDKHEDPGHAAVLELEEEAHLVGGRWYSLLEEGGREGGREGGVQGAPADKYSSTFFNFYLVVDPEREEEGRVRGRDEEELLVVHRGVGEGEVRRLIREGRMTVPAACASLLALEKLRELGLLKAGEGREEGRERAGGEEEKKKKEAWMSTVRGGGQGGREVGAEVVEEEEGGFSFPEEMGSGKRVWFAGMMGGRNGGREGGKEVVVEEEEKEKEKEKVTGFVFPSERGSGKRLYSTHDPTGQMLTAAAAAAAVVAAAAAASEIEEEEEEGGFTFPSERGGGKRKYNFFSRPERNHKRRP
ncbi:nudix family protein [Nannochloropsis oceanica]